MQSNSPSPGVHRVLVPQFYSQRSTNGNSLLNQLGSRSFSLYSRSSNMQDKMPHVQLLGKAKYYGFDLDTSRVP